MKKKLLAQIAKLAMLTFVAVIIITGSETMTVHASGWDGWTDGSDNPYNPDDKDDWNNGGGASGKTEEEIAKEQEEAIKSRRTEESARSTFKRKVF